MKLQEEYGAGGGEMAWNSLSYLFPSNFMLLVKKKAL